MHSSHQGEGFKVIEMLIALITVGLIIVIFLGGNYLLKQGRLKSLMTNGQIHQQAVKAFYAKYQSWPGDMHNAQDVWGKLATGNGNGNQKVEWGETRIGQGREYLRVWEQLSLAGLEHKEYEYNRLITPGTTNPRSKLKGGIYNFAYQNAIYGVGGHFLSASGFDAESQTMNGFISAKEAEMIDIKMDDGLPAHGSLFVLRGESVSKMTGACVTDFWDVHNTDFDFSSDNKDCRLFWRVE